MTTWGVTKFFNKARMTCFVNKLLALIIIRTINLDNVSDLIVVGSCYFTGVHVQPVRSDSS
jgi:hypothetical protein